MKPHTAAAALVTFVLAGCPDPNGPDADPDPDAGSDVGPGLDEVSCPPLEMPAAAADAHVDASAAAGGTGSQAAPFTTLTAAFERAEPGTVIWIAAGTYRENLVIPDKDLVVHGGFAPGFASRTDACATIVEAANAALPVFEASGAVTSFALHGLTVQKGARGLFVEGDATVGATFTITSSVFAENGQPDSAGGGAYFASASATVSRSVFRENRASKGGALGIDGDVTLTIEDSLFDRNIGHADHGGAVYASPRRGTIRGNTFRGNEIGKDLGYGWGGAVIIYKAGATPVQVALSSNVFTDNLASVGAAVFIDDGAEATMSHDLLYRNRSIAENGVVRGAAIYVDGLAPGLGSTLVADHITIADNAYDETRSPGELTQGGAVYAENSSTVTITNSILWDNGTDALFGDSTTEIAVSYSVAPGQCTGVARCTIGEGVFEPAAIPFVDEPAGDYHEQISSPTIDRADPAADFSNEQAPNGGRANLGAYGNTVEASTSP